MRKEDFNLQIFANRFNELLQTNDETTYSIAKKLGLTAATISRYSNGKMAPKLPTLYAIADIFQVNPIWLMGCPAKKELQEQQAKKEPLSENEERLKELYNLTADLSDAEITALNAFVAGLKANRKPD